MWWLRHRGWVALIAELRAEGLLQQPVGDGRFSWTTIFEEWVEVLAGSHNLACSFAERLTHGEVEQLRTFTSEMGDAHRALPLPITPWSHLWVDHVVEYAATIGGLGRFGAFRGGREGHRSPTERKSNGDLSKGGGEKGGPPGGGGGGFWGSHLRRFSAMTIWTGGFGRGGWMCGKGHGQSKPSTCEGRALGMLSSQKVDLYNALHIMRVQHD